jgi:hypothetical protein
MYRILRRDLVLPPFSRMDRTTDALNLLELIYHQ